MNTSGIFKRIKTLFKVARRRNPIKIEEEDGDKVVKVVDTTFRPEKEDISDRVYLVTLDGLEARPREVEKHGDDMVLEYGDKACPITSKPIEIEGNQFYFTRDGFLGTMSLNKDTLLSGDVYQPSKESYERKLSKNINFDDYGIEIDDLKKEETEEAYVVESDDMGDVAALHGSKKTLKEMNEAKRLRKLLQPSSIDKQKMIMAVASGIAVGFVLYPRVMNQ